MPCGLWTRMGPVKHVLDGAQIPYMKGQLFGKRTCPGMPDDTLPWAVQKWLNWSICHVPSWEGTLATPGEYDWTVRLRQRYGFMSQRAKKEPQYRASKKSSKRSLMGWQSRAAHIQASLIMAALYNRAGHYIFILWFSSFFLTFFLFSLMLHVTTKFDNLLLATSTFTVT